MKQYYRFPAIFYFNEDGISIEFPDLPGCLPCADTPEQALGAAKEALALHLYGMEQDGDPIPEPIGVEKLYAKHSGAIKIVEVFMPPVRERLNDKGGKDNDIRE